MTVMQTALTSGSDGSSDTTSYATASVSPVANKLIIIAVVNNNGTRAAPTGISGAGLTFTKIADVDIATDDNLSLWRAMAASPSSGALTIVFANACDNVLWSVCEFGGVDTGGTNGSAAVVQYATDTGGPSATLTVTLAAFGAAGNAAYGAMGFFDNDWISASATPGSGFTEIHDINAQDPVFSYTNGLETEWRNDNDTTVDVTWSLTIDSLAGIAIEIKEAATVKAVGDAGGGSDALALSASLSIDDTGQGQETGFAPNVAFSLPDVGSGLDAMSAAAQLALTDAGSGNDALSIAASLALSDAGSGADSLGIAVAIAIADTGGGLDAVSLAEILAAISDVGGGTDQVSIDAQVIVPDTAAGVDQAVVSALVQIADTATATDAISILTEILKTVADNASGADAVNMNISVNVADLGAGSDALSLAALLQIIDSAGGTDVVLTFEKITKIASISFSLALRTMAFALAARAMDFSFKTRTMQFTLQ